MTFIHWFNQRQANERFMLLGAAIILIVLIISMALHPVYSSLQQNERRVARQAGDLETMQAIAAQIGPGGVVQPGGQQGSLVILLQDSARREGVAIATMQPIGEQSINTRLDDVSFNAMVRWLAALESQGITVQTATLRAGGESGTVDSSLLLRRH